jgi:LysM repeat protein
MLNTRFLLFAAFVFFALSAKSQDKTAVMEYIASYKSLAVSEMKRTGVPAAIKLAQGIHETDAGQSKLVLKSNNHFGIKCKSTWRGPSVKHDDDARNECFRAYPGTEDSYRDHSDFLRSSTRYASLFTLDPTDYASWAWGLKKAGYATNPKYPQILIRIIEEYDLQNFTLIALGKMEDTEEWLVKSEKEQPGIETVAGPEVQTAVIAEVRTVNYPTGEFKINDTRVVFVTNGTSFFSLAQKYNVPLGRLFEFNDMKPVETAEYDQLIFLQRKRKSGANEFHLVKPGETLYTISQEEGIRLESLLEYNLLKPGMQPAEGERLHLKTKASSAPALAGKDSKVSIEKKSREAEVVANTVKTATLHTVRRKETLYTISKIYGVSVEEMMNWNSMRDNELKPGQQLKIYKTSHHVNHKGS